MRVTLFGKKPQKRTLLRPWWGLSCPKSGSSGATLFVANVMDIFVPSMLRCFFWLLRYPRIYGADIACALGVRISDGSSPCVRGKQRALRKNVRPFRFIPALAGQILFLPAFSRILPVHPRVYGADSPSIK